KSEPIVSTILNGGPGGHERWYSFDWGNVHFVALDTELIGSEQLDWLEDDLASTDQPWTIAYFHRPAYSSGSSHGSSKKVRKHIAPILERHGVQLALAGHSHNYERTKPMNGVTHVVTGGGGEGVRPVGTSEWTAFSASVAHFVYVTVGDGKLRLHAIDASGKEFDGVEIH
ncbi:MAG: metallophosphoesterase, partial [Polyangiales bacterium]